MAGAAAMAGPTVELLALPAAPDADAVVLALQVLLALPAGAGEGLGEGLGEGEGEGEGLGVELLSDQLLEEEEESPDGLGLGEADQLCCCLLPPLLLPLLPPHCCWPPLLLLLLLPPHCWPPLLLLLLPSLLTHPWPGFMLRSQP
jgi:hypothetical protein